MLSKKSKLFDKKKVKVKKKCFVWLFLIFAFLSFFQCFFLSLAMSSNFWVSCIFIRKIFFRFLGEHSPVLEKIKFKNSF